MIKSENISKIPKYPEKSKTSIGSKLYPTTYRGEYL